MLEEYMYWEVVADRWVNQENWPTVRSAYFKNMPGFMRTFFPNFFIKPRVLQSVNGVGILRLSESERLEKAFQDIDSLVHFLGEKKYLLGDTPSRVDSSMFAILDSMVAKQVRSKAKDHVLKHETLRSYINRMYLLVWPGWAEACAV